MNAIVDRSVNDSGRGVGHHRMPSAKEHRGMMIPMEQDQGFLVHHNEEGIKKFTLGVRVRVGCFGASLSIVVGYVFRQGGIIDGQMRKVW